jgi:citrate synthase
MANAKMHSDLGWSDADHIVVRGYDLPSQLLGHVDFGGMAFLELMGRLPTAGEAIVFNACIVTLVEHGITPSAIAARMTYLGAPEALQGAVAAGLCGLGTVFVGTIEGSAKYLQEALAGAGDAPDIEALAASIVAVHRARRAPIAGLGHPIHKPNDPRTPRLFAIAAEHGFRGKYVALAEAVRLHAERASGKVLPLNATGAIGALASELGIPWQIARGLGVMARAVGLVGHILEEMREPIAANIWHATEAAVTAERTAASA